MLILLIISLFLNLGSQGVTKAEFLNDQEIFIEDNDALFRGWIKNWRKIDREKIGDSFHWKDGESFKRLEALYLGKDDWIDLLGIEDESKRGKLTAIEFTPAVKCDTSQIDSESSSPCFALMARPWFGQDTGSYIEFQPIEYTSGKIYKELTPEIPASEKIELREEWRDKTKKNKIKKKIIDPGKNNKRIHLWRFMNKDKHPDIDSIIDWTESNKNDDFFVYIFLGVKFKKYTDPNYPDSKLEDKNRVKLAPMLHLSIRPILSDIDMAEIDFTNWKNQRGKSTLNDSRFEFATPCPRTCPPNN